jgi:LysR family nitrogen assimilation transcriptional regulator
MDLSKVHLFLSSIEHGNLSNAARALRVSQPTLSRQIKSMEEEFGTPLFIRAGRGMILTDAGRKLQEGLISIDRQLRLLKTEVASVSREPSGEVTFGIPPSPRALLGVPLITAFRTAYPRIVVRVIEETSAQLRDLVSNGLLDLAIINTHEPSHGTISKTLGRERMLLVGPARANLSMRRKTSLNQLARLPLILTTRPNSLRLTLENALRLQGLECDVRLEANMIPMLTDLVAAGVGFTVLPAGGVRHLVKVGQLSTSPITDLWITWLIARPKSRPVSVAAERFYDVVCEFARKQVKKRIWQEPG